jgi:hypothetical protein
MPQNNHCEQCKKRLRGKDNHFTKRIWDLWAAIDETNGHAKCLKEDVRILRTYDRTETQDLDHQMVFRLGGHH